MISRLVPLWKIDRDPTRCIKCGVCERQCSNGVHRVDDELGYVVADESKCVNCQRCVAVCPTHALRISEFGQAFHRSANWRPDLVSDIYRQAETGSVLLTSMGNPEDYPVYWDRLLLNASQVTNPSIDPLREPMETRVMLGAKPQRLEIDEATRSVIKPLPPQLKLDVPVMFAAMSFGAISLNAQRAMARAAAELGTFFNTGEGGLHRELEEYADNCIVQVASGRFGVNPHYLNAGRMVEIKIGQGAKPGIGGHLPGSKITAEVSRTRMIPKGTDAISPAPHHDIYSIEDLRQLIYSLKEVTCYEKPIAVKIAAVHNVSAIASGCARAGADVIVIDGFRGGTGAAPLRIRDNVGIPIELALASVDTRLRDEGIRNTISLVAAGSVRSSADVMRAIALGADAVYIGTAALLAMGCHLCGTCSAGRCNWGIATQRPELARRLNPDIETQHLVNLVRGWTREIEEMLGGMGINSIDSLRGNRLMLRGVGLSERELSILGVRHAGE